MFRLLTPTSAVLKTDTETPTPQPCLVLQAVMPCLLSCLVLQEALECVGSRVACGAGAVVRLAGGPAHST